MSEARAPAAVQRALVLRLAVACLASAAPFLVSAVPIVTLLNDALEVRWRPGFALGAVAAAAGWLVVALPRGPRALRLLGAALSLVAVASGADRALFRARVDDGGLSSRGLFGTTSLAWREVTRVETGSALLVAWGGSERQVRVPVGGWRDDQRAALERSIARRVREAASGSSPR